MNKIKTLSFCALLILVVGASRCGYSMLPYWEPRNVKIDSVDVSNYQVTMYPPQTKELVVTSDLQCRESGFPPRDSSGCSPPNFAILSPLQKGIESNCNTSTDCVSTPTVINEALLKAESKLQLTTKAELLPGIYSPTIRILTLRQGESDLLETSLLETIKLTVPYGRFVFPETITQAGNYKIRFEPHSSVKFKVVVFFKDSNPNSDNNDAVLASFVKPPFESTLTFTERNNGTQTFYVKAKAFVEDGKTLTINSSKADIEVNIPINELSIPNP